MSENEGEGRYGETACGEGMGEKEGRRTGERKGETARLTEKDKCTCRYSEKKERENHRVRELFTKKERRKGGSQETKGETERTCMYMHTEDYKIKPQSNHTIYLPFKCNFT